MIQWLADHCQKHLLTEKWLLAPEMRIAGQWKDRVNLLGCPTINLHSKTLTTLVLSLVSNQLASQGLHFAGQATVRITVRSVLVRLLEAGKLSYFQPMQSIDGLSQLVARSIRDLRLADVQPSSMHEQDFESPAKAADLRLIYQAYGEALEQQRILDYAGAVELAISGIEAGSIALPGDLLILMPQQWRLSHAEQRLLKILVATSTLRRLEQTDLVSASEPPAGRLSSGHAQFEYFGGLGEVNEVRGVFQRILSSTQGNPKLDDVEILHTDDQIYVPLVLEQLTSWLAGNGDRENVPDLDALPVTFADGIACIYSRPGRALRAWLRWARHDFVQTRAVQLIREGLLVRPDNSQTIGYSRLANSLRQVPIGFRCDRYLPKISESIQAAEQSLKEYQQQGDAEASDGERPDRDFGLPALRTMLAMIGPLVELAPTDHDKASIVLQKAKRFLLQCARAENKLDRVARTKLLDEIDAMMAILQLIPNADLDVLQWLEELPIESHLLASGPQPGRVHVASLLRGGQTGRKQIYVIGLDDGRYPKRIPNDSILLDSERERLSENLATAEEVGEEVSRALDRAIDLVLADPDCRVCLSYSIRNLADDRACFPSASMLELYRVSTQNDDADINDLLSHLGPPVAFVSEATEDHLSPSDQQLASLLTEANQAKRQVWLEEHFAHVRFQRMAYESEAAAQFNEYDGLVPAAGVELDPSVAERVSASQLETYGTCPRRFFFRHALGVRPPDEWIVDRERWLDPLQLGNLVHGLFEQFLGELTRQDLVPSADRDRQRLLHLLHTKINSVKRDVPIPNEDAYRRTCDVLEATCDIFLAKEELYCREHHARPWVLEASIGLDEEPRTELDCREPIALWLSDGRLLRVGGRLDRVDKLLSGGSERYAIWDYKSGSSFGFDQENPLNQGRKLQPYLYVGMLRHRVAAIGGGTDAVESFGYFFPSVKTDGLRMQWTWAELQSGDDVLKSICDLIAGGVFVATTDPKDCTYCDYLSVCGDAKFVAAQSLKKSVQPCNDSLEPWRQLRQISVEVPS